MSNSASLASTSSPPVIPVGQKFLEECREGNLIRCKSMIDANPDIILFTTPLENNCLHIAAMLGHDDFFIESVWSSAPSSAPFLFSSTNVDGETPLIAALMAGHISCASNIITHYPANALEEGRSLTHMLLKEDRRGENALHHALRNGFENFACELLDREKKLSELSMKTGESPMFMAARRGYARVVEKLLQIPSSAHKGTINGTALHAAVRFDHRGIVETLLVARPELAECQDSMGMTPLQRAIKHKNLGMVEILLRSNPKLAYIRNRETGDTPLITAAELGFISIAEEIMRTCPDSAYTPNKDGHSALHVAIKEEKLDFVNYILKTPKLQRLINQADNNGSLPLHQAAEMCNPELIRSLLTIERHDYTAVNGSSYTAVYGVAIQTDLSKTLKWNESFTLLSNLNPPGLKQFSTTRAKTSIKKKAIKEIKSRIEKYMSNTSLVAALLATVTFAAAFTLPGGFDTDVANIGHPIFARKTAFQVFLISDTIAMCSSLTVAFLCILTTWEDMDFLLNYRLITRLLMWLAYETTGIAFGTGLYTVLMPHHKRLAIPILVLGIILPFLSMIIAVWPLLMLWRRLGCLFQRDLVTYI